MADDEVKIDKDVFHDRLSAFIAAWKNDKRSGDALFGGAASLAVVMGKMDEAAGYQKNNAFQFWLLGYEFPATLILIAPELVYIVTTKKKAEYLEPLQGGKVPLEILVRGKDTDENNKIWEKCTEAIKSAGNKIGVLSKVQPAGPFAEEWRKTLDSIAMDVEPVDMALGISSGAMAVKDEKELRATREAARASSGLLRKYYVDEMSEILDDEKKITHRGLAEKVSNKIEDTKYFKDTLKVSSDFDQAQLDWAYPPCIQSGGTYELKLPTSEISDDKNLHAGIIIASLGLRYKFYASAVARTYLVDPNKSQEGNYKVLLAVHDAILKEIKDGVTAKSVYDKAISVIKSKKPDLEKNFLKNVGWGIGIEARDGNLILNANNTRTLRDGMTLCITTGFKDLTNANPQDKKSATYSLLISDTVRVTPAETVVFTKDAPTDLESTSFFFKDEEEEKPEKAKPKKDSKVGAVVRQNITKTRLRQERATNQDAEKDAQRRAHQKELHSKAKARGLERYGQDTGSLNDNEEKKFKRFESYKRDSQFPPRVKDLIICVDQKASTIVLPIMGRPVPFHINTIKNASRTEEGKYTSLRINFLTPGQGVGRKDDQPFEDLDAHFVRSLTFRSKDMDRMADITDQITELKKASVRKEQEKKNLEDVVEQDKLIEMRARRPAFLENVTVRPALEGKRMSGKVEIHPNGLRYIHPGAQKIDILFSNIKHLFFQPCDHEMIVIIHVHLVNPILLGKKKTKDIQFLRDALEMTFDDTGNRKRKHRFGDEEEFEAEQQERQRRSQLNREFKKFAEQISDAGRSENLSVDIPFRELGFTGVPSRSSVLVVPTTDCLVSITEPPFLIVTLSEIELVHLERVQYGLRNFDMVLIFRDFQRSPVHVNTIPVEVLDAVKDWLDSCEIPFSEGPLNLNWTTIMKTVTSDPHAFFAEGGWGFLAEDSDDEAGAEEESDESAFEMSDSEVAAMSDESSEDDSEFDEDASAEASEEDVSGESEEGEDWDELEAKAAKKDRESGLEPEEGRKASKPSNGKSSSNGKKKR